MDEPPIIDAEFLTVREAAPSRLKRVFTLVARSLTILGVCLVLALVVYEIGVRVFQLQERPDLQRAYFEATLLAVGVWALVRLALARQK